MVGLVMWCGRGGDGGGGGVDCRVVVVNGGLQSDTKLSDQALLLTGEGMPASEQSQQESKPHRFNLFQDEQLNSFFRRLAWSPDGLSPPHILLTLLCAFLLMVN